MPMDMSKFKAIYLSEAQDHIQKLNDNLLLLEKTPSEKSILDELMRSSHTLKGSSAAMGYTKTAFLTHVMEDVFDYARNGHLVITSDIMNVLFKTVDALERTIDSVTKHDKELDVEEEARTLKKITGVITEGIGKSIRDESGKPILKRKIDEEESLASKEKDKTFSTGRPSLDASSNENKAVSSIDYIKVPVERLDRLMALLEELIIDKMKLVELAKKDESLGSLADHLDRLVSDLQFQVMQARLVPVEQIFARFPRLVRDTAMQMKKEVNFQIIGGEIELDRTIVDKLAEPLVHLLKNAVDHGIEQKGTITLTALREKEFAIIMVENDGKEINWEKIRANAVSRGIVSSDVASRLDKAGLMELLYIGRLSTKDEVTETSGRGIGMSVVRDFAEQNGGHLQVESPLPTGGTRFKLELPLSIAIIDSLLMEVDNRLFAIPFSVIDRSVRITRENIKSMGDQDVAIVGEKHVPLVYLSKLFEKAQIKSAGEEVVIKKINKTDSVLAVLLQKESQNVGLVVDALHDKLEIIVKPLPSVLRKTKGFSGSTILGDGRTILIVDAVSLLEDSSRLIRTNNL